MHGIILTLTAVVSAARNIRTALWCTPGAAIARPYLADVVAVCAGLFRPCAVILCAAVAVFVISRFTFSSNASAGIAFHGFGIIDFGCIADVAATAAVAHICLDAHAGRIAHAIARITAERAIAFDTTWRTVGRRAAGDFRSP